MLLFLAGTALGIYQQETFINNKMSGYANLPCSQCFKKYVRIIDFFFKCTKGEINNQKKLRKTFSPKMNIQNGVLILSSRKQWHGNT